MEFLHEKLTIFAEWRKNHPGIFFLHKIFGSEVCLKVEEDLQKVGQEVYHREAWKPGIP